jgi:uroporphyrinogen-III synthase
MRILVVRPQPGADATAARLRAMGHDPVAHPLLATRPLPWALPAESPDAVILSSAAAVRHAGPLADALKHLPAHAVGEATAAAARAAGWSAVKAGPGTMQALLDGLASGQFLHLAGADLTAVTVPPALTWALVKATRTVGVSTLVSVSVVLPLLEPASSVTVGAVGAVRSRFSVRLPLLLVLAAVSVSVASKVLLPSLPRLETVTST